MRQPTLMLLTTFVLSLPSQAIPQTPASMINLDGAFASDEPSRAASAANPWIGAQLGYDFLGSDDFANSFVISARLLKDIDVGVDDFGLPVMGNLGTLRSSLDSGRVEESATILLQSAEGISIGLFPYYFLSKTEYVYTVAHGSVAWKANAFGTGESDTRTLNQAKMTVGLEVGLGSRDAGNASTLTLSGALARTWLDTDVYGEVFGSRRTHVDAMELTAVTPIGGNLGFLVESIFAKDFENVLRLGLIVAGDLGGGS